MSVELKIKNLTAEEIAKVCRPGRHELLAASFGAASDIDIIP